MENYIVRIYQRDDERNAVAGIVEIVSTQEEKSFKSYGELLSILNVAKPGAVILWETRTGT